MSPPLGHQESENFAHFRECVADALVSLLATEQDQGEKRRKRKSRTGKIGKKTAEKIVAVPGHDGVLSGLTMNNDRGADTTFPATSASSDSVVSKSGLSEELADFIEYISEELFASLPEALQSISYTRTLAEPDLISELSSTEILDSISNIAGPSVADSLLTYSLPDLQTLLTSLVPLYIAATTPSPPVWSTTRPDACELCDRSWIPLTYHHLIPRSVADKAVKRGWCEEWETGKVAWLCRACHTCVHRVETNESLAKDYNTLDALRDRDDIEAFVKWVSGVRWKKK